MLLMLLSAEFHTDRQNYQSCYLDDETVQHILDNFFFFLSLFFFF